MTVFDFFDEVETVLDDDKSTTSKTGNGPDLSARIDALTSSVDRLLSGITVEDDDIKDDDDDDDDDKGKDE